MAWQHKVLWHHLYDQWWPWLIPVSIYMTGYLTLKHMRICFEDVILFSNVAHCKCNVFVSIVTITMNICSALWVLMSWCFSTRASVATVLSTHPCVSSCLWVNDSDTKVLFTSCCFMGRDEKINVKQGLLWICLWSPNLPWTRFRSTHVPVPSLLANLDHCYVIIWM